MYEFVFTPKLGVSGNVKVCRYKFANDIGETVSCRIGEHYIPLYLVPEVLSLAQRSINAWRHKSGRHLFESIEMLDRSSNYHWFAVKLIYDEENSTVLAKVKEGVKEDANDSIIIDAEHVVAGFLDHVSRAIHDTWRVAYELRNRLMIVEEDKEANHEIRSGEEG